MALTSNRFEEFIKKTLTNLKSFFISILLLSLISPLLGVCQERLRGIVKSTNSGEIIPYATIIIIDKRGGTYSDEEGKFEISITPSDSLTFSSIGFKRITISVKEVKTNGGHIYLDPDITQLESVTIQAKRGRVKPEYKEFGYTKTKRRYLISFAIPGVQIATFIMNDSEREGFIESLLFGITCERKSRIRIRLYRPTIQNGVGTEITKQNLIFDVSGNHKRFELNMSKYEVPFGREGIVVAIEFLGEVGKNDKIKNGTIIGTKLYLTDGNDKIRNTWESYRERDFVRESFSDNQRNTSNALIGLSAVFYNN
ncbi:MAG: carboxypeptidase-like regulatory domain-containing protein [Bacteroidota bacterium]